MKKIGTVLGLALLLFVIIDAFNTEFIPDKELAKVEAGTFALCTQDQVNVDFFKSRILVNGLDKKNRDFICHVHVLGRASQFSQTEVACLMLESSLHESVVEYFHKVKGKPVAIAESLSDMAVVCRGY